MPKLTKPVKVKARDGGDVLKRCVIIAPGTQEIAEIGLRDATAKLWFKRFTVYDKEVLQLQTKSPLIGVIELKPVAVEVKVIE